jgi:hypothetical protein
VVPVGTFSVYTRARFDIADPAMIKRMVLGVDYDDAFVAWVNGVEVLRAPQMPAGTPAWNTDPALHESSNFNGPRYDPLVDIAAVGIPALQTGENVLAVGVWNGGAPASSDLVLIPRFSVNGASVDNCPDDPNPNQVDTDGDGIGDACDLD